MDRLIELKNERRKLEERIKQIENELKKPMSFDAEDNALEAKNREILYSLYQVEKENLIRLNADILNTN
jgi:RNA polymerase-binding transcription factor DksA